MTIIHIPGDREAALKAKICARLHLRSLASETDCSGRSARSVAARPGCGRAFAT